MHDHLPSTPTEPDWRASIEARWEALRRAVLGFESTPRRKLSDLGHECQHLAVITAWFESEGNITRATTALGSNRRTLREHVKKWLTDNPLLAPSRPDKPSSRRRTRRREHDDSDMQGARQP